MKCKSLFLVLVFMLLNSTVVCAEEEVLDDTQHMSQIQEEVNENLESVEEEKNFEETEKEQELIEKPVETDKVEVHRGWFYDTQVKKWFFYDNQGKIKYGWIKDKTSWYYLDKSDEENPGAMLSNCKADVGNDTYFFDESGAMQIGWVKKAEGWYYANQNGAMQTGWKYINKRWYYLDGENKENPGIMIEKCKKEIKKKFYFFNNSGAMQIGWVKKAEGWYYTNQKGVMQTEWKYVNKKWYYLDENNYTNPGLMLSKGKKSINKKEYFFDASGAMKTGWISHTGNWYYSNRSGEIQSGWKLINKKWYYLNPQSKKMVKGWNKISKKWYYLDSSGAMKTNWQKLGGKWYYLGVDGGARTGWKKIDNTWYYFYKENDSNGVPECAMAVNKMIDGWTITGSGESYCANGINKKLEEIKKYISVPYRYGGASTKGWDCSGFTQWAMKYIGVSIPRTVARQYSGGRSINKNNMSLWNPGDILVYASGGRVNHVALYLGNGMLMHALNSKYGTLIQGVSYYEKWDHKNSLYAVRRYL